MTRSAIAGFAVVLFLAAGTAAAVGAFVTAADVLPDDIARVLQATRDRPTPRDPASADTDGGMEFVSVVSPPTGVGRAFQIVSLGAFLGAIPAAAIAASLASRTRRRRLVWPAGWSQLFLAFGLFQFWGLVVSILLVPLFVVSAVLEGSAVSRQHVFAGLVLLNCPAAVWGLRGWRELRRAATSEPLRVMSTSATE